MSYWERRLPHWIPEHAPIFVTWRLAGALPHAARLQSWMDSDAQLDRTVSGPRWLAQPALARIVMQALRYGEADKNWYRLHAWVVMPNHVHVVMTPQHAFSEIMRWLKWTTARRCNQFLKRTGIPFWQDESYDHWIRNQHDFERIVQYVEWNPVAAGLVECTERWPWSSASKPIDAGCERQATRSPAPPEM